MTKTDSTEVDRVIAILGKAGQSNNASREAVTQFHGGIENVKSAAKFWASHHGVFGCSERDIVIAYCAAVDFGWRICHKEFPKV